MESGKKNIVLDQVLKRVESKAMFLDEYVGHASPLLALITRYMNLIGNIPWWSDLHVLLF